ncbi:hypothetical protein [Sphingobacterium bovisgrunnientis]|jgi:hypothetical protein|uniref:hypothetical protein n=1 Tax=Sphingobacterium bovisgrunnientis TaxID=1874697 RepID=UPI00135CEAA1|nr:hypothetical protein [Sphingobacterium bovisgrunnientis]
MENHLNFTNAQLLEEWLKADSYQKLLASLDVISVGMEGLDIIIQLKSVYPHLRFGYMYHTPLNEFLDTKGCPILYNFTYIPLDIRVKSLIGDVYSVQYINRSIVHQTLKHFSDRVLILGGLTDATLIRLLDFYNFNQKKLLLRRPMYFETSSLRGSINKFLRFSKLPSHIHVMDTIKINRCLQRLGHTTTMKQLHDEVYAHWFALICKLLKLPNLDMWDTPRIRIEAGLYY